MEQTPRDGYKEELDKKSGYCNCLELQPLFEQRKKAVKLEKICDSFKAELGEDVENLNSKDRELLVKYKEKAEQLENESNKYHSMINQFLRKEHLKIDAAEKFGVNTIHCNYCGQQIDVADFW